MFDFLPPSRFLLELRQLGILTYATTDGWCYPVSESAASVVEALTQALIEAEVELHLNTTIAKIQIGKSGFNLSSSTHNFQCNRLVIASGGRAYPALGSTGALFSGIKNLGHSIRPLLPALAPVEANISAFHKLQGVRLDVNTRLWKKAQLLGESTGNLIITSWGFNGPAVMNLSHLVSLYAGEDLQLELDLLPRHKNDLKELLTAPRNKSTPVNILLGAVLPHKMPKVLLQLSKLSPDITCSQLDPQAAHQLWEKLTSIRFSVKGTRGFEFCQLKVGGVPLNEIHPASFQSRVVPRLYLAGEVLDVVGPCGGFNLHFAFASGFIAGVASASASTNS